MLGRVLRRLSEIRSGSGYTRRKHPHYFPLCLQVYADMYWAAVFRALSPQKLNENKENDTVNMKLIGAGIPGRVPRTYCLTWPGRVFIPS